MIAGNEPPPLDIGESDSTSATALKGKSPEIMRPTFFVCRRNARFAVCLMLLAGRPAFGQQPVPIDIMALPVTPQGSTIIAAPGSAGPALAAPVNAALVNAASAHPVLQLPPPPATTTTELATNSAVALPSTPLSPTTAATPEASMSPATMAARSQTVRAILVESLPERIEKNDDWGEQRERLSQFKPKLDGLRLRVETTTKPVNHGLWKQLVVVPVDPQKNLRFQIVEARGAGRNGVVFQVVVFAPLKVTARVERRAPVSSWSTSAPTRMLASRCVWPGQCSTSTPSRMEPVT